MSPLTRGTPALGDLEVQQGVGVLVNHRLGKIRIIRSVADLNERLHVDKTQPFTDTLTDRRQAEKCHLASVKLEPLDI